MGVEYLFLVIFSAKINIIIRILRKNGLYVLYFHSFNAAPSLYCRHNLLKVFVVIVMVSAFVCFILISFNPP